MSLKAGFRTLKEDKSARNFLVAYHLFALSLLAAAGSIYWSLGLPILLIIFLFPPALAVLWRVIGLNVWVWRTLVFTCIVYFISFSGGVLLSLMADPEDRIPAELFPIFCCIAFFSFVATVIFFTSPKPDRIREARNIGEENGEKNVNIAAWLVFIYTGVAFFENLLIENNELLEDPLFLPFALLVPTTVLVGLRNKKRWAYWLSLIFYFPIPFIPAIAIYSYVEHLIGDAFCFPLSFVPLLIFTGILALPLILLLAPSSRKVFKKKTRQAVRTESTDPVS